MNARVRVKQRTVARPVRLEGKGLHTGTSAKLTILPAALGSGIRFRKNGIETQISARSGEGSAERRTRVGEGGGAVETVEHLLAAMFGLGVANAICEIDGSEIPGLDGSAADFVKALREAGLVDQAGDWPELEVTEPLFLHDNRSVLAAHPYDGFKVTYTLDYDYPGLRGQTVSLEMDEASFEREIAPARTFCTETEAEQLRAAGFGLGADKQNTLVMGPDGPLDNALRFDDECARHKVLDLIGDLALAGCRLRGHVIAVRSGHKLNRRLVETILNERKA